MKIKSILFSTVILLPNLVWAAYVPSIDVAPYASMYEIIEKVILLSASFAGIISFITLVVLSITLFLKKGGENKKLKRWAIFVDVILILSLLILLLLNITKSSMCANSNF